MDAEARTTGEGEIGRNEGTGRSDEPARGELAPPMRATEPMRAAPARFGVAGISAGEDRYYKTAVAGVGPDRGSAPDVLARGLAWFGIGLGLVEVFAAGDLARWLGMQEKSGLLRACGVREIGTGAAILMCDRPADRAKWMWGRVAGDAVDVAILGAGLNDDNPNRDRVAGALAAVGAVTVLDVVCAAMLSRR